MEIITLTSRLKVEQISWKKEKFRKSTGKTKEEGNLLVTMEQSLFPLETLQEQGMEYFLQLHLLLRAVELCPGQGIYSFPQIVMGIVLENDRFRNRVHFWLGVLVGVLDFKTATKLFLWPFWNFIKLI